MFENSTIQVCFFKKILYVLKQALQVWYQTFLNFFKKLDFHKIEIDHGLFILADKIMFIAVYVDNLLKFDININLCINNIM